MNGAGAGLPGAGRRSSNGLTRPDYTTAAAMTAHFASRPVVGQFDCGPRILRMTHGETPVPGVSTFRSRHGQKPMPLLQTDPLAGSPPSALFSNLVLRRAHSVFAV